MTKKPLKILCSGDVNGKFSELIGRVSAVNKKCGPFDLLFCVGEFFGPNEEENRRVVDGLVDFPVETYILGYLLLVIVEFFPMKCFKCGKVIFSFFDETFVANESQTYLNFWKFCKKTSKAVDAAKLLL